MSSANTHAKGTATPRPARAITGGRALLLCVTLAAWLPGLAAADALRCGTRLVTEGDTRAQVEARCGAPADITRRTRLAAPIIWRHGRPYRVGDSAIEVVVDTGRDNGINMAGNLHGWAYRSDCKQLLHLDQQLSCCASTLYRLCRHHRPTTVL